MLCLALGCTARSPNPANGVAPGDTGGSGGVGGSSGPSGVGGAGTGGIGGAGNGGILGGTGATGASCFDDIPFPDVIACALSEGGNGPSPEAQLRGRVSMAAPDAPECESNTGYLGNFAPVHRYTVHGDGESMELALGAPGGKPILTPDQEVIVTFNATFDFWKPDAGTLAVTDVDNNTLYWLTQSTTGRAGLDLPLGFDVDIEDPSCFTETMCGTTGWGGILVVHNGGFGARIPLGGQADVGDYTVIFVSSSSLASVDSSSCADGVPYDLVAVAFVPRGLTSRCYGLAESTCASTESCRELRAYFDDDTSPRFVTCVADDSCIGGGESLTCAYNSRMDRVATFTTSCTPPGWIADDHEDCQRGGEDAGAP